MTEAEWLTCADVDVLLKDVAKRIGPRKLRLFAVACCRRIGNILPEGARLAVDVAERFADGLADAAELEAAEKMAFDAQRAAEVRHDYAGGNACNAAQNTAFLRSRLEEFDTSCVSGIVFITVETLEQIANPVQTSVEAELAERLRCVLGNPFRQPLRTNKKNASLRTTKWSSWLAWHQGTIPKLAQGIYAERAFDRLPVLADALEDAGCDNGDMLAHCRSGGEHVRGCWVVDLLLGKE